MDEASETTPQVLRDMAIRLTQLEQRLSGLDAQRSQLEGELEAATVANMGLSTRVQGLEHEVDELRATLALHSADTATRQTDAMRREGPPLDDSKLTFAGVEATSHPGDEVVIADESGFVQWRSGGLDRSAPGDTADRGGLISHHAGSDVLLADEHGFVQWRSGDPCGLGSEGVFAPKTIDLGGDILSSYDGPGLIVADPFGFIQWRSGSLSDTLLGETRLAGLELPGVSVGVHEGADLVLADEHGFIRWGSGFNATGDYALAEIVQDNLDALARSGSERDAVEAVVAAPVWNYNQVVVYGQSLGAGEEAWPVKTSTGRPDVLMVGRSTRPETTAGKNEWPASDGVFRPAVSTLQSVEGAMLDDEARLGLRPGDHALGEDPLVSGMIFARRLFLQRLGVKSADDRKFVITNLSLSGTTVEQLSRGAPGQAFERMASVTAAVKKAAEQKGGTHGIAALFWLQGEFNYAASPWGSLDKRLYKTRLTQLYRDFVADLAVGTAGQADPPAMITYQTGGSFTSDEADLSISMAQLELSEENAGWYLATPAYPVTDKGGHLDANGTRWLGLQLGKVFHTVVAARRKWRPLSPIQAMARGRTVLVSFYVPCPPLQFRPVYDSSQAVMYAHKGFTVIDERGEVPIEAAILAGPAVVQLNLLRGATGPVHVYYGRKAPYNGAGNLCDSDSTVPPFEYEFSEGSGDYPEADISDLVGRPYPLWNWCVQFKISATAN